MLAQFQSLYPTGNLITELVQIYNGKYIVRSNVQIEGVTRATGMAAAETIEEAEDRSITRALTVLGINQKQQTQVEQKEVTTSSEPNLQVLPNRSVTTAVAKVNQHQNSGEKPAEITQPPSKQTAQTANYAELTLTSDISPTPEVSSAQENSNVYSEDLDKPLPIPTYNEPEFEAPIENTDIPSDNQPELEENPTPSNVTPLNKNSTGKTTKKTTKTSTTKRKKKTEPIDLSDVIAKTDVEMERLGWTPQQGREYLIQTYGKRGRTLLTEDELLDFLKYLEDQPTQTDLLETDPLAGF